MSSYPTLVNIFVNPVADVPVARDSVFLTAENTPGTGTLPATNAVNDPITYSIVYSPNMNFSGTDSFTLNASDAPLAVNRTMTLNQGSSIAFITLDGSDLENNALTYAVTTSPVTGTTAGSMSGSLAGMSPLEFTPARDFSGQAQLVYSDPTIPMVMGMVMV